MHAEQRSAQSSKSSNKACGRRAVRRPKQKGKRKREATTHLRSSRYLPQKLLLKASMKSSHATAANRRKAHDLETRGGTNKGRTPRARGKRERTTEPLLPPPKEQPCVWSRQGVPASRCTCVTCHRGNASLKTSAEQQTARNLDAHTQGNEHTQTHERRGATGRTRSRCAHEREERAHVDA